MKTLAILALVLSASLVQSREVVFAWDANPEPDVVKYRVYIYDLLDDDWDKIAEVSDNAATPANDTPNEAVVASFPNVTSRVRATAVNAAGLESPPSEEVIVEADAPNPPGGLRRKVVSLQTSSDLGETWQTVADYYLPADEERMFARLEFREEDVNAQ